MTKYRHLEYVGIYLLGTLAGFWMIGIPAMTTPGKWMFFSALAGFALNLYQFFSWKDSK